MNQTILSTLGPYKVKQLKGILLPDEQPLAVLIGTNLRGTLYATTHRLYLEYTIGKTMKESIWYDKITNLE